MDSFYNVEQISTHTPLAGRDEFSAQMNSLSFKFLLTRPSRDVTPVRIMKFADVIISTHTPLAGRDYIQNDYCRQWRHFYSHAPRGT